MYKSTRRIFHPGGRNVNSTDISAFSLSTSDRVFFLLYFSESALRDNCAVMCINALTYTDAVLHIFQCLLRVLQVGKRRSCHKNMAT